MVTTVSAPEMKTACFTPVSGTSPSGTSTGVPEGTCHASAKAGTHRWVPLKHSMELSLARRA